MKTTFNQYDDSTDHDDGGCRKNISLGSLVGLGGMGKTTLVQSVFNDKGVQSHFDLKIWVCVSDVFDVKALTRRMWESAMEKRPDVESLAMLQQTLKNRLMSSNRVLVVLDDAWNDTSISDWERLLLPLRVGLPAGSKILLTTRMKSVMDAAEKALRGSIGELPKRFQLNGLPEGDFLPLFNWHAFAGVDPDDYMRLQSIGKQIAARLGGLPLAAKVVGSMLNCELRVEYWETILENSISKFEEGERGVMSVLRSSYHHLNKHLRPCFAYCSIFPQDHVFYKDELVHMWMAVGLIQQSTQHPNETPEDTGRRYFDVLLRRSFFEPEHFSNDSEDGDSEDGYSDEGGGLYIMHDLLHELAVSVSDGECFRFVDYTMPFVQIPKSVRHLYFSTGDIDHINLLAAAAHSLKNLRTLHISFRGEPECELPSKIFHSAKRLRILVASHWGATDTICKLKHLRCLKTGLDARGLPEFHNYNLQTFTVDILITGFDAQGSPEFCSYSYDGRTFTVDIPVGKIPMDYLNDQFRRSVKNLISLRHCCLPISGLNAVRKLISLQELSFVVEPDSKFNIGELENLTQLRKLKIEGLQNVRNLKEARAAKLHGKEHLSVLGLYWNAPISRSDFEEREAIEWDKLVLECLKPHPGIRELIIVGYGGANSANWMKPEFVGNLQIIELEGCEEWEHLPPFGRLPFLKHLALYSMPAVKQLDCEGGFQQLKLLEIRNLQNLEDWSGLDAWDGRCFPCLQQISIEGCPDLKVLPSLPLSLIRLSFDDVGLTALPNFLPREMKGSDESSCAASSSSSSSSLSTVDVANCHQMSSLEPLKALTCRVHLLQICRCFKLVQGALFGVVSTSEEENSTFAVDHLQIVDPLLLLTEPLRKLNSVQQLVISCNQLESMVDINPWLLQNRSSLEHLELFKADSLQSLPADFQLLSSLKMLRLDGARQLWSLPQLSLSLTKLSISSCSKALYERCRGDGGADWPNIKHIPLISLDIMNL